jgi:hypothetical protein
MKITDKWVLEGPLVARKLRELLTQTDTNEITVREVVEKISAILQDYNSQDSWHDDLVTQVSRIKKLPGETIAIEHPSYQALRKLIEAGPNEEQWVKARSGIISNFRNRLNEVESGKVEIQDFAYDIVAVMLEHHTNDPWRDAVFAIASRLETYPKGNLDLNNLEYLELKQLIMAGPNE